MIKGESNMLRDAQTQYRSFFTTLTVLMVFLGCYLTSCVLSDPRQPRSDQQDEHEHADHPEGEAI